MRSNEKVLAERSKHGLLASLWVWTQESGRNKSWVYLSLLETFLSRKTSMAYRAQDLPHMLLAVLLCIGQARDCVKRG